MVHVGIIGAGISGLVCARSLLEDVAASNLSVSVYEWGRGPGGRTSRRRIKIGDDEVSFDHAAPFFHARTSFFRDGLLATWQAEAVATKWESSGNEDLYVGIPAANSIAKHLASIVDGFGTAVKYGHHVQSAEYNASSEKWMVTSLSRATNEVTVVSYDALVLSDKLLIQPNKYAVLSSTEIGVLALPGNLASKGAVVLLAAFKRGQELPKNFAQELPGVYVPAPPHDFIEKTVHDSAKPHRGSHEKYDLWVVHSTPEYAASHLIGEQLNDQDAVLSEMKSAFLSMIDPCALSCPLEDHLAHASVMAWDHARPVESTRLEKTYLLDSDRRLGACGDYLESSSDGAEAVAVSGLSLAKALAPLLQNAAL